MLVQVMWTREFLYLLCVLLESLSLFHRRLVSIEVEFSEELLLRDELLDFEQPGFDCDFLGDLTVYFPIQEVEEAALSKEQLVEQVS